MTNFNVRITEILRGQFPLNGNDVHAHVAALIAQAAEQHYRQELGWKVERGPEVCGTCGHPKIDHAHVPTDGRTGIQIANCIAGRGEKRTNCECPQWRPVELTRLVTEWSPGAGE